MNVRSYMQGCHQGEVAEKLSPLHLLRAPRHFPSKGILPSSIQPGMKDLKTLNRVWENRRYGPYFEMHSMNDSNVKVKVTK